MDVESIANIGGVYITTDIYKERKNIQAWSFCYDQSVVFQVTYFPFIMISYLLFSLNDLKNG